MSCGSASKTRAEMPKYWETSHRGARSLAAQEESEDRGNVSRHRVIAWARDSGDIALPSRKRAIKATSVRPLGQRGSLRIKTP